MKSTLNNKKAQGIIAAIFIILIASIAGLMAVSLMGTESTGSLNYMYSQQAQFIADGGLQYYFELLQADTDWSSPPTQPTNQVLGRGTFTITTTNALVSSITVTSTATVSVVGGVNVIRQVSVNATRNSGVPAAFNYFLYGNSPAGINFTGSTGAVTGDLRSAGNISGIPAAGLTLTGTATPSSAVTFPAPTYASYLAVADQVKSGVFTFLANTTYNGIYYCSGGNVTFQSGAKLYGTLILASANKSIIMDNTTGVVIDPSLDPLHPSSSYPAIISAGVITGQTTTNLKIKRLIYTDKNSNPSITFRYSTGLNFFGTVVSNGGVDVRNNTSLSMVFDSNILTNPPPYFSGGGTQTVGTSAWDEVY